MESRQMVPNMTCVRDGHMHRMGSYYCGSEGMTCDLCYNEIEYCSLLYGCSVCGYVLHLSCGEFPLFINVSSHPLHPLKLSSLDNITCYYCEKSNEKALMYSCNECSFYIHFACSKVPLPIISCDTQNHVQYICHNHPMTIVEHDSTYDGVIKHCFACQSPWSSGPAYTCKNYCPNVLHKACTDFSHKIENSFLHPNHSLKLQVGEPQSCDACHKRGGKLMYFCCEQGCNFKMGTECAFLKPTIKWDRHNHLLFLMERAYCGNDQYCDVCRSSYEKQLVQVHNEVCHTEIFLFRCMECNFNIHFLCGPLPHTIKHDCHMDVLTLVDTIDEDELGEYYCDICEEKRDPRFRVYYCVNCKFVAHIHCAVSEVMKVLKGDLGNVKLIAVGDTRWKYNDTENGNERMPNEEVEGQSTLTLRDILQRLTEEERNELMNPFLEKTVFESVYEKCVEKNSLVERKGPGEDISRLQNLLNFRWSNVRDSYMNEFRYFIPKDGLKLDEVYLKMKVVDVKGYQVPETLAPVLKTMMLEYGDLGGKSSLTPEMRSIACTFVCILIDRMSATKVEDITKDVLRDWFFYWQAIKKITDFHLDFLYDHLRKLIRVFLGSEAFKFQNEMVERLQQSITDIPQQMAELQTKLNSSKVNLEKLKSSGESSTSDFMRDNLREYSKLKWKDACEDLF